jgi:putative ATP-dependent endonuclease of OLD family
LLLSILERLVRIKQNKRFRKFEEKREYFSKEEYRVFQAIHFDNENTKSILEPVTRVENGKYFIDYKALPKEDIDKLNGALIDHINFRKHISMVLGLDEPEIHLHPYSQRSLIKYVTEILENKDIDFSILLKEYFDIDSINGQIITVSHAPTILSNNYKEFVRFYKGEKIEAISGENLILDQDAERLLLLNLPYVTEAFFSRCVILVEGPTELGALPLWANKIIGDLDEYGIVIINVYGRDNITPVSSLLNHFKIQNVSIIDKDDENDKKEKFASVKGLRTTGRRDFEEELYEAIFSSDSNVNTLFNFVDNIHEGGVKPSVQVKNLANIAHTYSIPETWDKNQIRYTFEEIKNSKDGNLTKAAFLEWMGRRGIKGIILGRALGQYIEEFQIPDSFKQLFLDAQSKVEKS